MTISYAGNFARLLFRWKGSIWKSIWLELLMFLTTYYSIRMIYIYGLDDPQQLVKRTFDYVAVLFNDYTKQIPLTFLLGFYVALIVKRWWEQFECVAWPDDLLSYTCAVFHGDDETSRLQRHTIARYANLTAALAWREISVKVRCRFPLIESFVHAGLMTEDEMELYLASPSTQMDDSVGSIRWQLPLNWIQRMLEEYMNRNSVSPPLYSAYLACLMEYRAKFQELFKYDWVCVPLVYTQVAALATYGYFTFCLLGRQFLNPDHKVELYEVDFYIPIFTILQFLFFVGWFKVGQDLMRPFGEDDDDIELNYILDRNVAVSFALVHHAGVDKPLATSGHLKDKLYDAVLRGEPIVLPHTRISAKIREHPPKMHAFVDVSNPRDVELTTALVHPQVDLFVENVSNEYQGAAKRLANALSMFGVRKMADEESGSFGEPPPLASKASLANNNGVNGSRTKADSEPSADSNTPVASRTNRAFRAQSMKKPPPSPIMSRSSSTKSTASVSQPVYSIHSQQSRGSVASGDSSMAANASAPAALLRCQVNVQRVSATTMVGSREYKQPSPSSTTSVHRTMRRTDSVMAKAPAATGVFVVSANVPRLQSQRSLTSTDTGSRSSMSLKR